MVMEAWELRAHAHERSDPNKIKQFREKHGDIAIPMGETNFGKTTFLEVAERVNGSFIYAPMNVRHFLSEAIFEGIDRKPLKILKPRGITSEEWLYRAEAILGAYYGTRARNAEIGSAFSIPPAAVWSVIDRYFYNLKRNGSKEFREKFPNVPPIAKLHIPNMASFITGEILLQPRFRDPSINGLVDGQQIKSFDDLWEIITPYLERIAKELLDLNVPLVISGNRGSGKTGLGSRLYHISDFRGENVDFMDMVMHKTVIDEIGEYINFNSKETDVNKKKVLIIDEIQTFFWSGEDSKSGIPKFRKDSFTKLCNFLDYFQTHNIMPIIINAAHSKKMREAINVQIKKAGEKVGFNFHVYYHDNWKIPIHIAREFFEVCNTDPEVIDFCLRPENQAVLSPRLFMRIAGNMYKQTSSLEGFRSYISNLLLEDGLKEFGKFTAFKGFGSNTQELLTLCENLNILKTETRQKIESLELELAD